MNLRTETLKKKINKKILFNIFKKGLQVQNIVLQITKVEENNIFLNDTECTNFVSVNGMPQDAQIPIFSVIRIKKYIMEKVLVRAITPYTMSIEYRDIHVLGVLPNIYGEPSIIQLK